MNTARLARVPTRAVDRVRELHREVDEATEPLVRRHEGQLQCRRGCHECCIDGLSVSEVEAALIVRSADPAALRAGPSESGCAFLGSAGECRIYPHRPYVCRTQGLPLRWLEEDEHDDIVEQRDVCHLNVIDTASLAEGELWLLGPYEQRLADLQHQLDGRGERIALRDVFAVAAQEK